MKHFEIPEQDLNEIKCLSTIDTDISEKVHKAEYRFLMALLEGKQAHHNLFKRIEQAIPEILDYQHYHLDIKKWRICVLEKDDPLPRKPIDIDKLREALGDVDVDDANIIVKKIDFPKPPEED